MMNRQAPNPGSVLGDHTPRKHGASMFSLPVNTRTRHCSRLWAPVRAALTYDFSKPTRKETIQPLIDSLLRHWTTMQRRKRKRSARQNNKRLKNLLARNDVRVTNLQYPNAKADVHGHPQNLASPCPRSQPSLWAHSPQTGEQFDRIRPNLSLTTPRTEPEPISWKFACPKCACSLVATYDQTM
jgi:hypothetical protein